MPKEDLDVNYYTYYGTTETKDPNNPNAVWILYYFRVPASSAQVQTIKSIGNFSELKISCHFVQNFNRF